MLTVEIATLISINKVSKIGQISFRISGGIRTETYGLKVDISNFTLYYLPSFAIIQKTPCSHENKRLKIKDRHF